MKRLIAAAAVAALSVGAIAALPALASDLNPYRGSGRAVEQPPSDPSCDVTGCPVPAPVPPSVPRP